MPGLKIVWVISREREREKKKKRDHCPGLLTVKGAREIRERKISYLPYIYIYLDTLEIARFTVIHFAASLRGKNGATDLWIDPWTLIVSASAPATDTCRRP